MVQLQSLITSKIALYYQQVSALKEKSTVNKNEPTETNMTEMLLRTYN